MNRKTDSTMPHPFAGFEDMTAEALTQYGAKEHWLNQRSLDFFNRLAEAQMPTNLSAEGKAWWHEVITSISLDVAPLVYHQAVLQLMLDREVSKPATPKVFVARGYDEREAQEKYGELFNPYIVQEDGTIETKAGDLHVPAEKWAGLVETLVKDRTAHAHEVRRKYKKAYDDDKANCCDPRTVRDLCNAITQVVIARSKLMTPIREDSLSANRMMEDAFFIDLLWKVISPISVWAYWTIMSAMNSQWGRTSLKTSYWDCVRYARRLGQLAEDEIWDAEGHPVTATEEDEARIAGLL